MIKPPPPSMTSRLHRLATAATGLSLILTAQLAGAAQVQSQSQSAARTISAVPPRQSALPARLSDTEFWNLVVAVSEPDGYFRSNNFVSNETLFQHVIPTLEKATTPGHVYMGVGPEQNFTYIAALKPKMAFIIDIRRGNLHLHLLYKAVFELSGTRAEFLSRLFSRSLPSRYGTQTPVDTLFRALVLAPADTALYRKNFQDISDLLLVKHKLPLSATDLNGIRFVYDAFFEQGGLLEYGVNMPRVPNYSDLMTQNDGRNQRSYLATEANWLLVRDMHLRNLIVPVVGDFGGDKAIRAIGDWLKDRKAIVQAFYTSNVEQYLFESTRAWRQYYENVATLPLDETSMFIRANGTGGPGTPLDDRLNVACSIRSFLSSYYDGRVTHYSHTISECR